MRYMQSVEIMAQEIVYFSKYICIKRFDEWIFWKFLIETSAMNRDWILIMRNVRWCTNGLTNGFMIVECAFEYVKCTCDVWFFVRLF